MTKRATSITLDDETVRILDDFAVKHPDELGNTINRSEAIKRMTREYDKGVGINKYKCKIDSDLWNAYMYYCYENKVKTYTAYDKAIESILKGRIFRDYIVKKDTNHDMIIQTHRNIEGPISVEMMKIVGDVGTWVKKWYDKPYKCDWDDIGIDAMIDRQKKFEAQNPL